MTASRGLVILGGCGLAFGAAFANTGFLLTAGTSISHLTGDVARLAVDLAQLSPTTARDLLHVAAAAGSFLCGALAAGFLIHHPTLDFTRPYGRSIAGIGVCLLLAAYVMPARPVLGVALGAFGCGLQNALAAHYRGLILRTTHVTGLVTDMGVMLGMRLRGHGIPGWKIVVPALLIASFFLGGAMAAGLQLAAAVDTIQMAGAAYLAAGLAWGVIRVRMDRASRSAGK